jgi:tetratricopeptide (TPR) repeat protein
MNSDQRPPPSDPEDFSGPEALQYLLRQADQADHPPLEVPPELDAEIVREGRERIAAGRRASTAEGTATPPPLPAHVEHKVDVDNEAGRRVVRVAFRRRLTWLAAAAAVVLACGWWFRQWSEAPIEQQAGLPAFELKPPQEGNPEAVIATKLPDAGSVTNALALAAEARAARRTGEAIEYYEQALARDANEPTALLELGRLAFKSADLPEAEARLNRLLEAQPEHRDARIERAWVLTHSGKYAEAEAELDALLSVTPEEPRLISTRGTVELLQGRIESALDWRQRWLATEPTNNEALSELRQTLEWAGKEQELPGIIATLASSATNPVKRAHLKLLHGNELVGRGDVTNALLVLEEVAATNPDDATARFVLARTLAHQGQLERAEAMLRELLARPEVEPRWRLELAHNLHHQGREAEFWQEFSAAHLAAPTGGAANHYFQVTHRRLQSTNDPAFAPLNDLFREALERHPELINDLGFHHVAWLRALYAQDAAYQRVEELLRRGDGPGLRVQLAELLYGIRNYDGVLREADASLRLDPAYAPAWRARGLSLEMLGRHDEAVESYKRALLIDPTYDDAAHNLIRTRDKQQQPRKSVEDFTELIERRASGRVSYYLWRAYASTRTGSAVRGLEDIEAALQVAPGHLNALASQADTLTGLGRYDPARVAAQAVLARSPQHRVANAALGKIAMDFGDLNLAEQARQRLEAGGHAYEAHLLRGRIQLYQGRFSDSIQSLTTAERFTPDASAIWEYRAPAGLLGGDFTVAHRDHLWLLERFGPNDPRANWWLVHQYLAMRGRGFDGEAAATLKEALSKGNPCQWPYPMLRMFAGEIPPEVVLAKSQEVAFDMLKKTEFWPHRAFGYEVAARAGIGMFAEFEGDYEIARTHFRWLIDHPDPMWREYQVMATNRLRGIEGRVSRKRLPTADDVTPQPGADLSEGLLAWLPMTADLNDHSPANLPVTVHGSVRMENGVARFPGDGNFLELPHVPLGRREFSISFWMKSDATNEWFSLFSLKEANRCHRALWLQLRAFNELYLGFFRDDVVAPLAVPDRAQWNHVVVQYSRFRQSLWLNGRQLVERYAHPLQMGSGPFRIGAFPPDWGGHHEFHGWMRDFRIYGRALHHTEIHELAGVDWLLAGTAPDAGGRVNLPEEVRQRSPLTPAQTAPLDDPRPFLQIAGNQLLITAPPVQVYELQFSPDLNRGWSHLATLTNTTGSVNYVDAGALTEGMRYYRVQVRTSEVEDAAPQ